ncbi:MAG TPA: hypothetical protein EYG16_10585 [Deltaproteobacteria bacterium]|nr:hypothetical protein [Candidatus Binatota bacterium]HIL14104.1 hypothetical protein [Deltaproteobacteria bacterium]
MNRILKRGLLTVLAVTAAGLTTAAGAYACDLCSVYTTVAMEQARPGPRVGLATQFSSFKSLQEAGEEVDNDEGEMLRSSVTQLLIGYNFNPSWGVQASVPWIDRRFRQADEPSATTGREDGLGDIALTGRWVALDRIGENQSVLRASLRGGIKLPTGNSDLLAEEHHDPEIGHEERSVSREGDHEGGLHGHDLALGTGSVDYLAGMDLFASRGRAFASLVLDYALRTEGDHDYQHADDLTIAGGPGVFFTHGPTEHRVAMQLMATMQSKGQDTQAGEKVSGSALTALYLGPRILYSWRTSLVGHLALDLPAVLNNSGLSLVPDYRLRVGLTWLL